MQRHTLSVLVENKPGVLARVSGLFSRRGFNIESLAVGPTEHADVSRMTIVVAVEDFPLEQVTKQLNKLVHVLKIVELEPTQSVQRQVLLVKVRADPAVRSQVLEIVRAVPRQGRRRRARGAHDRGDGHRREDRGPAEESGALRHPGDGAVRHHRRRPWTALHHRHPCPLSAACAANITQTTGQEENPVTVNIYYDDDADLSIIQGRKVAVIGYGSQGHAHSLSLRDSGVDVRIGLQEGSKSRAKAADEGLTVGTPAEVSAWADVIMILAPDTKQRFIYADDDRAQPQAGRRDLLRARLQHPLRPHHAAVRCGRGDGGAEGPGPPRAPPVRRRQGRAVPHRRRAGRHAAARRRSRSPTPPRIGGARAGVIETTFTEETETDLFGEQAVLCGGAAALVQTGFEVLTEAGYAPEIAYFECLHELKLIVDLMYEGGIANERFSISDTAEYGDLTRGPRVITSGTKDEMRKILGEIQDGSFAREWVAEDDAGRPNFSRLQKEGQEHPIEEVGEKLRGLMSWVGTKAT